MSEYDVKGSECPPVRVELLGSDKWCEVVAVLEAGALGGQDLTGSQATNLLLLLHCTVRRAAGATLVPARHEPRSAAVASMHTQSCWTMIS